MSKLKYIMHPDDFVQDCMYEIEWIQQLNTYATRRRVDDVVFMRLKTVWGKDHKRLMICGTTEHIGVDGTYQRRIGIPWKSIRSITTCT